MGRFAAFGLACACGAPWSGAALGQAKPPPNDKAAARGVAGSIVQYEESPGRAIVYLDAQGGMLLNSAAPAQQAGDPYASTLKAVADKATVDKAALAKAASAKGAVAESASPGASPLRAAQRKAVP